MSAEDAQAGPPETHENKTSATVAMYLFAEYAHSVQQYLNGSGESTDFLVDSQESSGLAI